MRKLKKSIVGIILIALCLQMKFTLLNLDASYQTIDDDLNTRNIGVPSHSYYSSIFKDSFVYLFDYTNVDVMDISNPKNIHVNTTYGVDFQDFSAYYNGFYFNYNQSQNEFFHYYIKNIDRNHTFLVYNKYELINNTFIPTLGTETAINITLLWERAYFTQQNNKLMVAYPTRNSTQGNYNISLLTFDITNKSAPLLKTKFFCIKRLISLSQINQFKKFVIMRISK
ncbi:MAG TPA: hypothetical protein VMZ29_17215 [Candidatus Bathyarchaeia archaeon]|nr:hypothetical protein [Candidatus Bathyarchaeia archaeon]